MIMVARPLRRAGDKLDINCATSAAGSLRVEIQYSEGASIPGFASADCSEIVREELERVALWSSGSDVSALARKTVRLRLSMRAAELYSLRFRR